MTSPFASVPDAVAAIAAGRMAAAVDDAVTIPMAGRAESLNVAMAGTVFCFEALRQRRARATAVQQGNRLPIDRHLPNRDAPITGVDL